MKPGEIYWVNLEPTIGDEIRKRRPVVVLNGGHKKHLRLAIVVPVTEWNSHWDKNPFFVTLNPTDKNGLRKNRLLIVSRSEPFHMTDFWKKLEIFPRMKSIA